MWVTLTIGFVAVFLGALWITARKSGKQNEQTERLIREVNERARANEILSDIVNLNNDELNDRLRDKREAANRSMHRKD